MLTQDRLKELLHYDAESGEFTWIKTNSARVKVGNKACNKDCHGYFYISIDKKKYSAHRLAWLYMHGKFPENNIDHIDGNSKNNCISNLREATQNQNLFNTKIFKTNTSGYKGVHFHKGTGKWRAVASVNNYPKHLGLFSTAEDASVAYTNWCIKNRGEFTRIGV
jgi:hypothetical protein